MELHPAGRRCVDAREFERANRRLILVVCANGLALAVLVVASALLRDMP